jgi:acid phosphatase type 7
MNRLRLATAAVASVACLLGTSTSALASEHGQDHGDRRGTFTLAAVGDIACTPGEAGVPPSGTADGPDNCVQSNTASLIESLNPNAVITPGDIQYQFGRLSEFMGSFDQSWGVLQSKIFPAAGNHEWYDSPNGSGYFDYFNGAGADAGRAGVRGQGYYSVNLTRRWHLITLNSNCTSDNPLIVAPVPCNPGSAQERWLRADLREHRGMCIIAQWHHPYFTSGPNNGGPNDLATLPFWHDLYRAGATLIFNGHDHGYERFAPQTDTGQADPRHGVREFVVGTGGKSLFGSGIKTAPNSQLYDVTTFGVTLFKLHSDRYSWSFYRDPIAGNGALTDQGSGRCNSPSESGE